MNRTSCLIEPAYHGFYGSFGDLVAFTTRGKNPPIFGYTKNFVHVINFGILAALTIIEMVSSHPRQ